MHEGYIFVTETSMAVGEEGLIGTNCFKKRFGRHEDFDKLTKK